MVITSISILWMLNEWLRTLLWSGHRSGGQTVELGTYIGVSCRGALTDAHLTAWASKGNMVGAGMRYSEKWRVGGLEGHVLSGSLPDTSACCTVVNKQTITPSSQSQENKQSIGRHGEFRKAPMGATNNVKAGKGKNNDCHHNKNLSITKNDGQIS